MGDIWSGDILLPDETVVQDISLASQNVASPPSLPAASLRFVAAVDTARIPLYLAFGPSLDVWTTTEATEEWFSSILLSKTATGGNGSTHGWWAYARAQSPIGILAKVEDGEEKQNHPRITEVLFYGTVAADKPGVLPTPPSSSPDLAHLQPDSLPQLRVHALPLSSDLLYQDSLAAIPPLSPAHAASKSEVEIEPQFLAPTCAPGRKPNSPKRKRDIFDEATQAKRRARGKGGEGVAAAAARTQESQRGLGHRKSLSIDTKAIPQPDTRPNSAHGILGRPPSRQLSRSPSISSDIRPLSRRGNTEGHSKRSALSQVATIPLQPEEPTTETRNKESLSRVVMAAMRMHGLQQRKKNKSRRGSVAPGIETPTQTNEEGDKEDLAKDEEYKVIYHQTFKGAVLAFRKHISIKPLHSQPDRLRHVVERLLAIFCTDPLTVPLPDEGIPDPLATPGSKQRLGIPGSTHSHASPFDLPSGSRVTAVRMEKDDQVHTGSPISRKRMENQPASSDEKSLASR